MYRTALQGDCQGAYQTSPGLREPGSETLQRLGGHGGPCRACPERPRCRIDCTAGDIEGLKHCLQGESGGCKWRERTVAPRGRRLEGTLWTTRSGTTKRSPTSMPIPRDWAIRSGTTSWRILPSSDSPRRVRRTPRQSPASHRGRRAAYPDEARVEGHMGQCNLEQPSSADQRSFRQGASPRRMLPRAAGPEVCAAEARSARILRDARRALRASRSR